MCSREYGSVHIGDSRSAVRSAGFHDQRDEHVTCPREQRRLSEAVLPDQAESGALRRFDNGVRMMALL